MGVQPPHAVERLDVLKVVMGPTRSKTVKRAVGLRRRVLRPRERSSPVRQLLEVCRVRRDFRPRLPDDGTPVHRLEHAEVVEELPDEVGSECLALGLDPVEHSRPHLRLGREVGPGADDIRFRSISEQRHGPPRHVVRDVAAPKEAGATAVLLRAWVVEGPPLVRLGVSEVASPAVVLNLDFGEPGELVFLLLSV